MASHTAFLLVMVVLFTTSQIVSCSDDVSLLSLETTVQQQAAIIQSLQARLVSVETSVQQQARTVTRLDTRVSFTSHITLPDVQVGASSPIVFNGVYTNIGSAYNSQTGVFTAPVPGLYVFYVQIRKHGNDPALTYGIYKGGQELCANGVETGNYDKSSCLATTHLLQGETIYVRRTSGDTVVEGFGSSFSGYLLSMD